MGELLMLFITGGGSTAMGAILKGVFGYVFEARQQKHDLEMAREARNNDNFLRLQANLHKEGAGSLFLLLVVFLLLSGCLRSVRVSSCAPSSPPQKSSHSQTQMERESTSSYSDSSASKPTKSHSLYLLDTSALWDAQ